MHRNPYIRENPYVAWDELPRTDPLLRKVGELLDQLRVDYADIWEGSTDIKVEFNNTPTVGSDPIHAQQTYIYGVTPNNVVGPTETPRTPDPAAAFTGSLGFYRDGQKTRLGHDNAVVELVLNFPSDGGFDFGEEPVGAYINRVYLPASRGALLLPGDPPNIDIHGAWSFLEKFAYGIPAARFIRHFNEMRADNGLPPVTNEEIDRYIAEGWMQYADDPRDPRKDYEWRGLSLTTAGKNFLEQVAQHNLKGSETWPKSERYPHGHYRPDYEYWEQYKSGRPVPINELKADLQYLSEYAGYENLSVKNYIRKEIKNDVAKFRAEYPHAYRWWKAQKTGKQKTGKTKRKASVTYTRKKNAVGHWMHYRNGKRITKEKYERAKKRKKP